MGRAPSAPRLPGWILERMLPSPVVECALGDLEEEYAIRAHAGSPRAANQWYWVQILRSLPALSGRAVRHAGFLQTLAVAILVFLAASWAESAIHAVITRLAGAASHATGVVVGLTAMAGGGYLAARIRQPAALVMAVIVLVVVVVLIVREGLTVPSWYEVVFLVAGPLASVIGGALAARRRPRPVH
jgi:hypothetical protein